MRGTLLSGVARSALVVVLGGSFAGGVIVGGVALAADMPVRAPAPYVPAWSWAGFYAGIHNAAFRGNTTFSDPFGPSIFGDRASTPGYGFGGQIGYNWQVGNWVYGLETDATWLNSNGGTTTCAASSTPPTGPGPFNFGVFPGYFGSSNCGARPDAAGTVTGRVGVALGPEGHTLAYAKGGLAWEHTDVTATRNNDFFLLPETNSASLTHVGWTVGAGVEQALTPAWSVKFEYDYLNFGRQGNVTTSASTFGPVAQVGNTIFFNSPVPGAPSKVSSDLHMFKLGLNYHFGQDPWSSFGARAYAWAPGWEFEGGGRYWYSWGRFQKDLPGNSTNDKSLISRLTYENTANTGEFFGRIDTPVNVFLKGYVGGGSINGGHMNDEDWAPFVPVVYSNTISNSVTGPLFYGTIDLGYDLLRGPGYKAGAFVGYNRYNYTMNANGCVQIANPFSDCTGAPGAPVIPTSVTGITEKGTWDSLRVGASAETQLFDRWKLSGDIAYIPYTKFTGSDNHVFSFFFDEQGHGQGVQAEAFLSYMVTDAFSLGVGGRYWALWTTSGTDVANGVLQQRNDTFRTERVGVTFQGSYKF